jgi:hypothetical protein
MCYTSEKCYVFNKTYEVFSAFLNVETSEELTYVFGLSNSLSTNHELGKLVGIPLFLWLEGPWIYSRNLKTHLIFGNSTR